MGFWSQVIHFDRTKINPFIALRNAAGLAIPLAAALAAGQTSYAFLGSLGAMNAAFSDGSDPYFPRARRMLAASVLSAAAIVAGGLAGWHPFSSGALILFWATGAGLLVALDSAAADIGLLSLVMVLVFIGQPMTPEHAMHAGLMAVAGGCLQTLLSIGLWPFRRYEPERRVIAALYAELSAMASSTIRRSQPPPATARANEAQAVVRSLGGTHTVQGDRYVSLVSQAERIRLSILAIRSAPYFKEVAQITDAIERTLKGEAASVDPQWFHAVQHAALAGQLRAAWELAVSSTPAGRVAFEQRQMRRPWRMRVESTLGTLRANATLRSSAMRHAIRLSAAVLAGEVVGHMAGGPRSYWLPMTAAIVLKPDFTATFSRGVLRIVGTLAGLAVATAMFAFAPLPLAVEVGIVFVVVFILRCFGPSNYGVLTAALSAYIVVLFALAGQPPGDVIAERALNSVLGGVLALAVYAAWPTWEHSQIRNTIAAMLEAYRQYFRAAYERSRDLEQCRLEGRLARSNAEAALARFAVEPRSDGSAVALLSQIMASSHRLIYAMMAIEAGGAESGPAYTGFAHKVEITLHSLAAAMRGSPFDLRALPDLRAAHQQLVDSGYSLVEETDRLTNSLNTLAEQVARFAAKR